MRAIVTAVASADRTNFSMFKQYAAAGWLEETAAQHYGAYTHTPYMLLLGDKDCLRLVESSNPPRKEENNKGSKQDPLTLGCRAFHPPTPVLR